jgi:hypothetical protein
MRQYSGPQEQLIAAKAPEASPSELRILAASQYNFVQTAVAQHPNTEPEVLAQLTPSSLQTGPDQYLAAALAHNKRTPVEALLVLIRLVVPYLDNQRGHQECFEIGVALCCNPYIPVEALTTLLAQDYSAMQFRKVVARETRRHDILNLLKTDKSETVRNQASKTLASLMAASNQEV